MPTRRGEALAEDNTKEEVADRTAGADRLFGHAELKVRITVPPSFSPTFREFLDNQ